MHLLPRPQRIEEKEGIYHISQATTLFIDTSLGANALFYSDLLNRDIKKVLGFELELLKADTLKINDEGVIFMPYITGCKKEGAYLIKIEKASICLQAYEEAGLLYAVQSLRQLIREHGSSLPCMIIEDEPALLNRGYNFDVTRGRVPSLESLMKLADTCSFYKINQLQLNVEHSYLFRNESELWRGNTPLTADDILRLDDYCKRLHIDLVPTLASFGHLYELLRSRTYSHLCELEVDVNEPYSLINRMRHHTVNVSDEASLALMKSRIKEYMDLFSSQYFNICADETFDLGKGKNKERAEAEGSKALYIDFLKKLCSFVMECGKTPMYWGDIIVEKPEILQELPKSSICLNWEYSPLVNEDNLKKFSGTKAENIFVCPGVQSWNHLINNHRDAYQNISKMCANGYKYKVKGVLNTDWGDLGHIGYPEFSTVGLIYGAAFSWNRDILPEYECNEDISLIQYGDSTGELVDIYAQLANQETLNWWMLVMYKESCQELLEEKNQSFEVVMNREKAIEAHEKNAMARTLIDKLYAYLPKLSEDAKRLTNAYILMGEGQILLGQLGATLLKRTCNEDFVEAKDPVILATAIERWFVQFSKLWRSVSKESELHRVGEILFWYADLLRQ